MVREGKRTGGGKGKKGKEKVTEGMGGTGQDIGWGGKGKGKEEGEENGGEGAQPSQTLIPGAATEHHRWTVNMLVWYHTK